MKSIFFALASLLIAGQASAEDPFSFYGHWGSTVVTEGKIKGNFTANSFAFTVSDWKIASFLRCAAKSYPKNDVFLTGIDYVDDDSKSHSVVTSAYICDGDINLSNCEKGKKVWFCK